MYPTGQKKYPYAGYLISGGPGRIARGARQHVRFKLRVACFHQLSFQTDGSRPTGQKNIPVRDIFISGGPGRTRTDTPCRT